MKSFIAFTLLVIGVCHAESYEERSPAEPAKRGALKRVMRRAIGGMGDQFLTQTEVGIISNCKANGFDDIGDELQSSYDNLKICIHKKSIFISSKEDYIANMEKCAQDPIKKTMGCLKEDQKYFPQFLLDLAKSVVSFMYDDFDIMRVDLPPCITKFSNTGVQRKYFQCLYATAQRTQDSATIPSSKESFCQKFIPASHCFTNIIEEECDDSPKLSKFREDYLKSMMEPCGTKIA